MAQPKPKKARMALGELTPHNVKQLQLINDISFPVSYSESFYKKAVAAGEFSKLAYYDDIVVGGVCCRKDTTDDGSKLYIMTLGCLAAYRRLGLGKLMLDHVLKLAQDDKTVVAVQLHVQIDNDDAIAFYKRFGFEVKETIDAYYKRVEPAAAHVLEKTITHA
eukprot:TRINITY_DN5188_c0_g1_i1.p1 TRINITY_DN5188_c0_g1~~TRINITY_DN5188_c0_g1_i1.p1  ORF type:complete len:163 (+),score=34.41 TRINITY_DN5188_c0_g1_i1:2-490(+)